MFKDPIAVLAKPLAAFWLPNAELESPVAWTEEPTATLFWPGACAKVPHATAPVFGASDVQVEPDWSAQTICAKAVPGARSKKRPAKAAPTEYLCFPSA